MNNLNIECPRVAKLIVLGLIISMLAGCASDRYITRNGERTRVPDGLSTREQVGIGIGAAVGAALLGYLVHEAFSEDANNPKDPQWDTNGPIIPEHFNFSDLKIGGYIQGGWPVAIDYQLSRPGSAMLMVQINNGKYYNYQLDGANTNRQIKIFKLPQTLGDKPVRAIIEIHATSDSSGITTLVPIKIFGFACGSKAVGSIGIDQINFGPDSINVNLGELAHHFYFAHKSFNKVQEEFRKIENRNGTIQVGGIAYKNVYDPFRSIDETSGQWIGKDDPSYTWDGKTEQKRPSIGIHQLQVRAWYTNNDKDWVVAFSPGQVEVKE